MSPKKQEDFKKGDIIFFSVVCIISLFIIFLLILLPDASYNYEKVSDVTA